MGSPRRAILAVAVALWLGMVLGGSLGLWRYKTAPGASDGGGARWPASTGGAGVVRSATRPTLLVFIHPECPCSRATLRELARLLDAIGGRAAATIVFVRPSGVPAGWERGENWDLAASLRHAAVRVDQDGSTAAAFGVLTSGHALLYDPDGGLRFSGGITAARGHEGDSTGRSLLMDMVLRGRGGSAVTAVFGCALRDRRDP